MKPILQLQSNTEDEATTEDVATKSKYVSDLFVIDA